jgi:glycosyltransferase involved in cell wall biosynthesis
MTLHPAAGTLQRPRMLVVTPRFPYPVIGGDRLRLVNLCRELAKDFDLTLASLCATRAEMQLALPADAPFREVHRVLLPPWRSAVSTALAVPSRRSLQVAYYASRPFARMVSELARAHDVLLGHLVRTAPYVLGRGRPVVLELTDAISLNYERVRAVGSRVGRLRSLVYATEATRVRAAETRAAREASLAVFVSEVDRAHLLGEVAPGNVVVFPNGVDVDAMPYAFAEAGSRICFIGNMTTLQNLDAAHFFATAILPLVRRERPDAVLEVVGRIGDGGRRSLAGLEGVRVVGPVADMAEAVRGAAVGVCPMRLGAGIQNKVLEYMSLGIPAVTSSVAFEGLGARPGVELLVADAPAESASAVLSLLTDRARARRQAEAARRHVVDHHSWPALLSPLRERVFALREATGPAGVSARAG